MTEKEYNAWILNKFETAQFQESYIKGSYVVIAGVFNYQNHKGMAKFARVVRSGMRAQVASLLSKKH